MCEKKPIKIFPAKEKVKKPKNTPAYYQCLLNASQRNFFGQPITSVCRNCKTNGNDLIQERNQQIQLMMTAYEQLGNSLRTLLTPLANVNQPTI